jgi:hypothetical protein
MQQQWRVKSVINQYIKASANRIISDAWKHATYPEMALSTQQLPFISLLIIP